MSSIRSGSVSFFIVTWLKWALEYTQQQQVMLCKMKGIVQQRFYSLIATLWATCKRMLHTRGHTNTSQICTVFRRQSRAQTRVMLSYLASINPPSLSSQISISPLPCVFISKYVLLTPSARISFFFLSPLAYQIRSVSLLSSGLQFNFVVEFHILFLLHYSPFL